MSVLEVAHIKVRTGAERDFATAVAKHISKITSDPGCMGAEVSQGIEEPTTFLFVIKWQDVDAHLRFRETDAYQRYRAAVGKHIEGANFTHFRTFSSIG
jgi:quinol monooxygenase YgiN